MKNVVVSVSKRKGANLVNNTRFYILVTSIILSVIIASLLRLQQPSDQLYPIRMEQIFGLLALIYWYGALVISPVGYVIGKQRMKRIEFARRAIGVSAAYFAVLHVGVAVWGQLGGPSGLQLLPPLFKWSLAGGALATLILLIMAATSFDRVVRFMTFKRWKLLHRLTYMAWVAVFLHIWTIGTHLAYTNVQWVAFAALVLLAGLELYRTTKLINDARLHLDTSEMTIVFVACWFMISFLILLLPNVVQNYHSQHANHALTHGGEHHE